MERINHFFYSMRRKLIFRLWTCMAVSVFPLCLIGIAMILELMFSASEQLKNSYQQMLDNQMYHMVQEASNLPAGMDDFVSDYIFELNSSGQNQNDVTIYNMLSELGKIMKRSGQSGLISILEKPSGNVLVQAQDMNIDAKGMDQLTNEVKDIISFQSPPLNKTRTTIGDKQLFTLIYEYQNYEIIFWLDMGENLSSLLKDFFKKNAHIYIFDGTKQNALLEIYETGEAAVTELSWQECMKPTFKSQNIEWHDETISLYICVKLNIYGWQLLPLKYWLLLIPAFICLGLIPFFWKLLKLEILIPFQKLEEAMKEMEENHLSYRIEDHSIRNSDEVQFLFDSFDRMASEMALSREKDKKMFQAELDNLRLQVNPHMLLNSFNMIYSLAQSKNYECIQEYALHLVEYFRYALRKNDSMVSISQEMKFVSNYIEIQKIRYPKAFTSVYSMKEGCEEALVPPLLIENFVENAMKYALKPGQIVEVLINIRQEEDRLLISVCDTGRGIKPEVLEQIKAGEPYIDKMGNRHIGIWNCKRRIEVFYEEEAEISIVSNMDAGTQVFINVPFVKEESGETINCR